MMQELSEDWGVDFVFSTATQPAFERPLGKQDLRWTRGTLKENIRNPQPLRRAVIRWEIKTPVSWAAIAERVFEAQQCVAIVNLKDHAC